MSFKTLRFEALTERNSPQLLEFRNNYTNLLKNCNEMSSNLDNFYLSGVSLTKAQEKNIQLLREFVHNLKIYLANEEVIYELIKRLLLYLSVYPEWKPNIKWIVIENAMGLMKRNQIEELFNSITADLNKMVTLCNSLKN